MAKNRCNALPGVEVTVVITERFISTIRTIRDKVTDLILGQTCAACALEITGRGGAGALLVFSEFNLIDRYVA